ncbi:SRPBCC domain-containing protein [Pontivivens insulae]|uniref:Activator of Hsp90 ATPase homologue 1/2-like C-terminal domain-containing protein n=1 Tax=Pontivivens insulae TaxID=1639689 RepID=A0A2R8A8G6_9RHOB|nr:SRPBCC domain-containing protein [Pontivivens insulae]RED18614.1 uncharacterized protein YndB with AHSA1/START domain [Pontivivens insulae]SPF28512.1 hypothetical protein POI8812_00813 [Pontivivens insulae]
MSEETTLELSRVLNAPVARVWDAWTDAEKFAQWWVPRPWRAKVHQHDVQAGGAFEMTMHGPDGEAMRTPGCFLLAEAEARIIFTSMMSGGFQPVPSDFPFTAIIEMVGVGEKTQYTARVLHPTPELRAQHEAMGFEGGWGTALTQLEELLAGA